jgi:hypothetical protein
MISNGKISAEAAFLRKNRAKNTIVITEARNVYGPIARLPSIGSIILKKA